MTVYKFGDYADDDNDEPDDDDTTVPCPYCHEPVYDDAEQCPSCRRYVSREDMPSHRPLWVVLGAVLCLLMTLFWVFH